MIEEIEKKRKDEEENAFTVTQCKDTFESTIASCHENNIKW